MKLLTGMRFLGNNGEHYELNISPILKNTFVDNMINLINKDTGVVERMNFKKFMALKPDDSYTNMKKYVKSRVDIVIEPGKVDSGEVYFNTEDNTMYTTGSFLDNVKEVEEVIDIYNTAAVYGDDEIVQSFRPVSYLKRFYLHEICNIDGEEYIASGVLNNHVELRKLSNIREAKMVDSYNKVASVDSFVPIRIGYCFTPYGLIPVLSIYDRKDGKFYNYTVINEKYLIFIPSEHVFRITKTELTLPIKTEDDIVKVANAGVEMFAEWAYDYRSMLPAINNVFGKDE